MSVGIYKCSYTFINLVNFYVLVQTAPHKKWARLRVHIYFFANHAHFGGLALVSLVLYAWLGSAMEK